MWFSGKHNDRAIVIPTYGDHFLYVIDLLNSFKRFLLDKDKIDICFVLSNRKEVKQLKSLMGDSYDGLRVYLYDIDAILTDYKISSKGLLGELGKYSYQTIKKLYGLHYLGYPQAYIMDSESLLLRETKFGELFDDYFVKPFILYAPFSFYKIADIGLNYMTSKNIFSMFDCEKVDNWYFETFDWFYDINILRDLFLYFDNDLYGKICEVAKNQVNDAGKAVFECVLYHKFIDLFNDKYAYNIYNTIDLLEKYIGKAQTENISNKYWEVKKLYPVFMHGWEVLNKKILPDYAKIYKFLNFKIARLFIPYLNTPSEHIEVFVENCDIHVGVSTDDISIKMPSEKGRNKWAVITPVYREHFGVIKNYLKSFDLNVTDKDRIVIYFMISKNEEKEFSKIIAKYKTKIDIRVLIFENILKEHGVLVAPDELLKKYGKFSFQTLKKFYSMLSVREEKFLVLDSESTWLKKVAMGEVFKKFFEDPFISFSTTGKRKTSKLLMDASLGASEVLERKCDKWFLENFVWFYDIKILKDLFKEFGSPMQIVEKDFELAKKRKASPRVFEILLYQNYIYNNMDKYGYRAVDVDVALEKHLKLGVVSKYKVALFDAFKGSFGLAERAADLANKENVRGLVALFRENKFNIVRCERLSLKNFKYQQKFIKKVDPVILAASQDNFFWG